MRSNLVISIIGIAFSAFFLYQSTILPIPQRNIIIGPEFWPIILTVAMLIVSVSLLIKTLLSAKKEPAAESSVEETALLNEEVAKEVEIDEPEIAYPNRMWMIILAVALYIALVGLVGFIITTVVFLFAASWILGLKKWISLTLTSVLSTAGLVLIFTFFLTLPLPRGVGIFRELSFLFY
ncbi:tripartite tricarboxylate transporter TctB family protein [Halalkalibacter oceani]|uniref:tripartite tricarboxylate transporter TctB family protein n=1 Tax=Halalkalibacter oceani TaxID=1653776 RepID=UPI00203D6922|nr:tripartite tricarboxylate transporter TctB family protein [Halalkalibacter oceani]MCM3761825.1 tripartite tricarboxylate transporter TctB family protein [Halalkalibacter oceani]